MEKNVKHYYVVLGMTSFFGYFIGTTLFVLLGGENNLYHSISGLIGAIISSLIYSYFYQKKFPGLNQKVEQLVNDERTVLVKGKSAEFTLKILYIVLVIIMFIGMFVDNLWIRYTSAGIFLVINFTNFLVYKIFDKRM